eukprot:gb/GFBE01075320.1/.p1 GENE.gb/GFBE01075320.1/~~gb/GFBE01075320.1/.p1  ORF type:complete len:346 (+),score=111.03 gb/GFBE01075320.1/:1-1038(+)
MDTKLGDVLPQSPLKRSCCCCCSVFLFVFIILFGPASVIQLERLHFGLAKNGVTGVVDMENPMSPGRYYLGFWMEMVSFPSTLNTIEFSTEAPEEGVHHLSVLRSRDKDGKRIYLDVSVQYRLLQADVGKIYKEMLTFYEDVLISELRNSLAIACNKFAISDAWDNHDKVISIMQEACQDALTPRMAECWGLQLWGIRLESKYEAALVKTQVRKQAQETERNRKFHTVVRAETQVMLAEYRKNKTIIEAGGEAQKFLIEQEAVATATQNLIEMESQSVKLVKDIVVVNRTQQFMTEAELIEYQKYIMLAKKTGTNFIIHSGEDALEAVNAQAFKEIAAGKLIADP